MEFMASKTISTPHVGGHYNSATPSKTLWSRMEDAMFQKKTVAQVKKIKMSKETELQAGSFYSYFACPPRSVLPVFD